MQWVDNEEGREETEQNKGDGRGKVDRSYEGAMAGQMRGQGYA